MKSLARFTAFVLLGAATFAGAQINMPNPQAPGSSIDTAVRLLVTNEIMVDRQIHRWLHQHYPGWDAQPHEFMDIGPDRYAVVYITSADAPARRIYFRVQRNPMEEDQNPFP